MAPRLRAVQVDLNVVENQLLVQHLERSSGAVVASTWVHLPPSCTAYRPDAGMPCAAAYDPCP
jgi:hypothetical protein